MIVGGQEYIVGAYVFTYLCLVGYGLSLRGRMRAWRESDRLGREVQP